VRDNEKIGQLPARTLLPLLQEALMSERYDREEELGRRGAERRRVTAHDSAPRRVGEVREERGLEPDRGLSFIDNLSNVSLPSLPSDMQGLGTILTVSGLLALLVPFIDWAISGRCLGAQDEPQTAVGELSKR
jgi:hypothetical protein